MKLPSVTIKNLLEAGVHLGHKTFRWNPKMDKFIFGSKDSRLNDIGYIEKAANEHETCKSLQALEGVGPLNAVNLYMALGCGEMGQFKKGRDASACIGLTPIQHSSGGKVKLGSVGKYVKNNMLRSCLVSGAMSAVNQAMRRPAKTKKERWIQQMVERRGKRCTAVALANKTVRT